jgi:hypothetical protein
MTLTEEEKKKLLEMIKSVDLEELLIPDEANRKWFKFGAYDALRILSERVLSDEKSKEQHATTK